MTLEEMLQQYIAAQLAKETPKEPEQAQKAVTEERLAEVLGAFAAQVSQAVSAEVAKVQTAVAEQVEKALPVREPGAGRAGSETPAPESELEANPVAYLARKARTDEGLSQDEKDLAWALTYRTITQGMVY